MKSCTLPFKILQHNDGYRYSYEPFILSDFAKDIFSKYPKRCIKNIIDIGTGSGVTALILSEYFKEAKITGVEIQKRLVDIALANISLNKLDGRIRILNKDIKDIFDDIEKGQTDLVVTNPPFRKVGNGKINPDSEKAVARHEVKLTLKELLSVSGLLLKKGGSFIIIYIPERLEELLSGMADVNIKPRYIRFVHHDLGSDASMVLVDGVKDGRYNLKCVPPLFINSRQDFKPSPAYSS